MKVVDKNWFELDSGKQIHGHGGIIGIASDGKSIFGGYDDDIVDDFTPSEKAEIADFMIAIWYQFKGQEFTVISDKSKADGVENRVPGSAEEWIYGKKQSH